MSAKIQAWCLAALAQIELPACAYRVAKRAGVHPVQAGDALRFMATAEGGRLVRVADWQRTGSRPRRLYDLEVDLPDALRPRATTGTERSQASRRRAKCQS